MIARHYGTRKSVSARRRHDYPFAMQLLAKAVHNDDEAQAARARQLQPLLALAEHTARAQDRILDTAEVA